MPFPSKPGLEPRAHAPSVTKGSRESSTRLLRPHLSDEEAPKQTPAIGTGAVDKAAADVRRILAGTLTRGMEEVGAYLLRAFYDDDPDAYASHSPAKHASLRMLATQCGTPALPVSTTFLSAAIRMASVARRLPDGASFTTLPASHRVELIRLPLEAIEPMASSALATEMPVRELRKKVTQVLSNRVVPRGRPRDPRLLRLSRALGRLLDAEEKSGAVTSKDLASLDSAHRAEVRATLQRLANFVDGVGGRTVPTSEQLVRTSDTKATSGTAVSRQVSNRSR